MKKLKQKILESAVKCLEVLIKWADAKLVKMRAYDDQKRVDAYVEAAPRLDVAKGAPAERLNKYSYPIDPIIIESSRTFGNAPINELSLLDTMDKIQVTDNSINPKDINWNTLSPENKEKLFKTANTYSLWTAPKTDARSATGGYKNEK